MTAAANRRVNFARWVVTQDTPDGLTLESRAAAGAAWWLYVVAGVLIGAFLLLAGAGSDPDSPPLLAALAPLFFVYWGLRMRGVRGGHIEIGAGTAATLTVQRGMGEAAVELPVGTVEQVLVQKRFLGWKLLIVHRSGGPIDVTPPDDMNVRALKDTANLLAARLGVEVRVAL